MGLGNKKCFIRKNGTQKGGKLYKWCPDTSLKRGSKSSNSGGGRYFCTTNIGTQGNDFTTTYTYIIIIVSGQHERSAYVQCDYVK